MRISARNVLKGKIIKIVSGAVNCEVTIQVGPDLTVTSIVTKGAVKELGLKKGKQAYAVIKSSSVMVGVD